MFAVTGDEGGSRDVDANYCIDEALTETKIVIASGAESVLNHFSSARWQMDTALLAPGRSKAAAGILLGSGSRRAPG
ncbi:MAG: hypothetical protein PGN08_14070 [Sphingomonas taxi]